MLVYFSGPLNTLIQQWEYRDLADRAARRQSLEADPDWIAFVEHALPLIVDQRSAILRSIFPDDAR